MNIVHNTCATLALFGSLGLLLMASKVARAQTFDPSGHPLLATYITDGEYNLVGLGTWNGQPVSPQNMPNHDERHLEATFNFYGDTQHPNELFLQVNDVLTTQGAYWFGGAFDDVTLTGVRITSDQSALPSAPFFSSDFANPGEVRAYGGSTESIENLTTTPGYQLDATSNDQYLIRTSAGAYNGFTSLGNIQGTSRIRGGGVFLLQFSPNFNVQSLDFSSISVDARYGVDHQYIGVASPVPEASTLLMLSMGMTLLGSLALRARRKIVRVVK